MAGELAPLGSTATEARNSLFQQTGFCMIQFQLPPLKLLQLLLNLRRVVPLAGLWQQISTGTVVKSNEDLP